MRRLSPGIAAALAVAAFAGIGAGTSATTAGATAAPASQSAQQKSGQKAPASSAMHKAFFGGGGFGLRGSERRRGPGWTQAQVKRMARKKRNQARNRRAHR